MPEGQVTNPNDWSPHNWLRRFSHNCASDLGLRSILRDPAVYQLHPEPEAAAAIMLVETVLPQIQAHLLNFSDAAAHLDVPNALADNLTQAWMQQAAARI